MFKSPQEMAAFVLETVNPEFPKKVRPGDILVAGRNFGCSSGRALATKALAATKIGAVVAEQFSRTFYRNCLEIGLPLLEAGGVHALVNDGDEVRERFERRGVGPVGRIVKRHGKVGSGRSEGRRRKGEGGKEKAERLACDPHLPLPKSDFPPPKSLV